MPRNRVGHGRRRRPRSHKVARAGRAEPPGLEIVCPLSILVGTGSGTLMDRPVRESFMLTVLRRSTPVTRSTS